MKKLRIIVPKDSLFNSYLQNIFYTFDKIMVYEDKVCYIQTGLSNPMDSINNYITMFMLSNFSISCPYGDYTFRVRS